MSNCHLVAARSLIDLAASGLALRAPALLAAHRRHGLRLGSPICGCGLVWDRDTDTVFVTKCYRVREATPVIHAAALKIWGKQLAWAWPRDGRRETLEGAGQALANQYRAQGLDLLYEHAQFEDKSSEARKPAD